MGYFLAVTAFRHDRIDDVVALVRNHLVTTNVDVEALPNQVQLNIRRDVQVYMPLKGWTVAVWPEYFNVHDFRLVRTLASTSRMLISTIHVYDDEYWEHLCCEGVTELHAFCSRPHFWQQESPDDYHRVMNYSTDPTRLCSRFKVPLEVLNPYLVDVDELEDLHQKARSDDEFPLSNFWVFTDFWRRLGIAYPNPGEGLGSLLRLGIDFGSKLPSE